MLIREEPATEATVATRILARAGLLPAEGRVTVRAGEVVYVSAHGVSNHTMTPYDTAIVRIADGEILFGMPPADLERYLAVYRAHPDAGSVIARADGTLEHGTTLRRCALRLLAEPGGGGGESAGDDRWRALVADARVAGTLIGAFPLGEE